LQARAYIYAHGGNPDFIPSDDMANVEIMLMDGMIGPKSILLALSSFATGNLNAKIRKEANPFKMADMLPFAHEYIQIPPSDEEKAMLVNKSLLTFMNQSPGAPKEFAG